MAGLQALLAADVVVTDRLAPRELLADLGPSVEVIDVAKVPRSRFTAQQKVNRLLVERARSGKSVVRLKGGDGYVSPDHPSSLIDWSGLARMRGTLVLLMAVENAGLIATALIDGGRRADTQR